jgi:hypothetical protein
MTSASIPLGDGHALRRAGKRSRIARVLLGSALGATAVAALLLARAPNLTPAPLLAPGSSGVIVLDVSYSLGVPATLDAMYAGLTRFSSSSGRFGVVLSSDRAYEALPPNTPSSELSAFARFFHQRPRSSLVFAPGALRTNLPTAAFYPTNPWSAGFSHGTELSKGLALARSIALAGGQRKPSVWLMSDLADDPTDRASLIREARTYVSSGTVLHVIALNPRSSDERMFERLFGPSTLKITGSPVTAEPEGLQPGVRSPGLDVGFVLAALVLILLLAANELWSTPLEWGAAPTSGSAGPS